MTELRVNDRYKDKMYLARKKPPPRRSSDFVSKIRQSIRLISTRKQEQKGMEQTLDDEAEAGTEDDEYRERLCREFGYTREEVETMLNQKTAGGEKKEKVQKAEEETNEGEYDEALSESDDAEGIVDALLARYTM
ncbi:uncharacterized protein N7496_008857 [Penicillium cataractarum]|uniref:Uncharacterized protein n=1 Tax=Penicillium cataractarum TaxID=2100454 RepID=A0A9W9RZ73_9EURO|nr:uncharacterized protein N7496_008857 [Penicillium cataractarum]KAJ5369097.1 hypothetical protein N7496_008857 [Penicillium cataractarum]